MTTLRSYRGNIIARSTDRFEVIMPQKLEAKEVGLVVESIVAQIEKLTGHPCLSGTHDLIMRNRFEDVAQIRF